MNKYEKEMRQEINRCIGGIRRFVYEYDMGREIDIDGNDYDLNHVLKIIKAHLLTELGIK